MHTHLHDLRLLCSRPAAQLGEEPHAGWAGCCCRFLGVNTLPSFRRWVLACRSGVGGHAHRLCSPVSRGGMP